jgi:lysyl-tRNA synthetase class I
MLLEEILAKKLEQKGKLIISLGMRPSGQLHLGNIATAISAAEIAYEFGNHRSEIVFTICDLDLPEKTDIPIVGNVVKHYRYAEDKNSCHHKNMSEHNSKTIYQLMEDISKEMGTRFVPKTIAEIQKEPAYRKGLVRILENSEEIAKLFPGDTTPKKALVFPICNSCHTANKQQPTFELVKEKGTAVLHTLCENPECSSKGPYSVDVLDTSYELAPHFSLSLLRDTVDPVADVHVFGGDYSVPHGRNGVSRAKKFVQLMEIAGIVPPDLFVGPLFYAKDGLKMSKTDMNGLSFENLVGYFKDHYVRHIREFNKSISDYKHVDYGVVSDRLLKHVCIN